MQAAWTLMKMIRMAAAMVDPRRSRVLVLRIACERSILASCRRQRSGDDGGKAQAAVKGATCSCLNAPSVVLHDRLQVCSLVQPLCC